MTLLIILSLPTYEYMQLIFFIFKICNRPSSFLKFSGRNCVVGLGNICFKKLNRKLPNIMWWHVLPLQLLNYFMLLHTYISGYWYICYDQHASVYVVLFRNVQRLFLYVQCTKIWRRSGWEYEGAYMYMYTEPVFVNLVRSPGIDSHPCGPERQSHFSYRPARIHRLAESIPRNRFLGSLNVYKYGLCNSGTFSKSHQCPGTFSIQKMSAWFSRHTPRYREREKDTGLWSL